MDRKMHQVLTKMRKSHNARILVWRLLGQGSLTRRALT